MASIGNSSFYLTVGELAGLFGVNARTISRWIDADILPGFQLPNARKPERRVLLSSFRTFVSENPSYAYALERFDARPIAGRTGTRTPSAPRRQPKPGTEDRSADAAAAATTRKSGDSHPAIAAERGEPEVSAAEPIPSGERDTAADIAVPGERGFASAENIARIRDILAARRARPS